MGSHQYTLEKYKGLKSRYACPACNKPRAFARYVNTANNEYIDSAVGRCNREIECGYHYKPKQFFLEHPNNEGATVRISTNSYAQRVSQCAHDARSTQNEVANNSSISEEYLKMSIKHESQSENNLTKFLKTLSNGKEAYRTANLYCIGSAQTWFGATVFWYIDKDQVVRSGKIMLYDPETGKRVKKPFPHITWVHSELKKKGLINEFKFRPCLFGEHLLINNPHKTIGIVESEKTAIIASTYLPELTWMACGSISALNAQLLRNVAQNTIILYPDINGFDKWKRKAHELSKIGFHIAVSDLLEKAEFVLDSERICGYDLADYLPRVHIPKSDLQRLIDRNPSIELLINRFGLVLQ